MKKVLYFSLVLTVMLAMVSCSSSTNSPGAAMKEYSKYLQKGDYVKFVDGLAFDDKQTPEQIKEQKEGLASMIKEKGMKEYEKVELRISKFYLKQSLKMAIQLL